MFERVVEYLLSVGGYTPHGYCLAWNPSVLYTHIISDLVIFASYTAIPVAMFVFARKRGDLGEFKPAMALFVSFILLCGLTHLVAVVTLWYPVYGLQGAVKAVTALVSLGTAIAVWPLIPRLLAIPAPAQLAEANDQLRQEIEQRREAEEKLRVALDDRENDIRQRTMDLAISEARFRTFASVSADWFWETDSEGLFTHVSEKLSDLTGIPQEEWVGRSLPEACASAIDAEECERLQSTIARREGFRSLGLWLQFPTGQLHFTLSGQPIFSVDGMFKGYRGVGSNTTEQQESLLRIERLNARFRLSIQAAPNAMIMVDNLGCISIFNRQAEELFGYRQDEMLGQPIHMLLPESRRSAHTGHMAKFFAAPEQRAMALNSDLTCLHRSGREIPVEIGLNPIEADDGTYVIASIVDVTEHRRVTEEIHQAREAAERASRSKSIFLANMSHEFRTPLNAVLGFSEAMKLNLFGALGSSKNQEYAEDIHAAATHLKSLISNVLDLSRIEAGKESLRSEVFEPEELIDECMSITGRFADDRKITLVKRYVPGNEVMFDRRHLLQVLINVVTNAIKYSFPGNSVEIALAGADTEVVSIRISDTGPGIAAEDIPKALHAFERLGRETDARSGGTGLGLPISVQLMEINGGSLTIESELGEGTTVTITLPTVKAAAARRSDNVISIEDRRQDGGGK